MTFDRNQGDLPAHNGQQDTCPLGKVIEGQVVPEGKRLKTFCEPCAASGMPDAYPPERTLAQKVAISIAKWQPKLNLNNWVLSAAEQWDPQVTDDEAYVWRQPAEMEAIIAVHPDTPDWYIDRLVVHELLHLVMAQSDAMAMNGTTIEVMELYSVEQERVINVLATALTDIAYEPITPLWRKRFEVEPDQG